MIRLSDRSQIGIKADEKGYMRYRYPPPATSGCGFFRGVQKIRECAPCGGGSADWRSRLLLSLPDSGLYESPPMLNADELRATLAIADVYAPALLPRGPLTRRALSVPWLLATMP